MNVVATETIDEFAKGMVESDVMAGVASIQIFIGYRPSGQKQDGNIVTGETGIRE